MQITLNRAQASALLMEFGGEDADMVLTVAKEGHSGPGLYAHVDGHSEEGATFLAPEVDAADDGATKEQVYDQQIFPLMEQVQRICMGRGIAMIAQFLIPTDEQPHLVVNSLLPDGGGKISRKMLLASRALDMPIQ